jgi:predicted O-methyltransferase YrrM
MKTTDLKTYFNEIDYNWKKERKLIHSICKITKSRVKPPNERFEAGWEQQYLIHAIAKNINARNFFEIGTGRGTTSYVLGLIPFIDQIITLDIVPFDEQQETALMWEPIRISNKELYDLLNIPGKEKIEFIRADSKRFNAMDYREHFDLIFIDGNHDKPDVIMEDFYIAEYMLAQGGIILFDDYKCPWGKGVTEVVDEIIEKDEWDIEMIEFRGHLFDGPAGPEKDQGLVIMRRREDESMD